MKRSFFCLGLIFIVTNAFAAGEPLAFEPGIDQNLIAHAGGGIDGITYTNSYEALNNSVHNGFALIEIDFSWTSDGQLVCAHDWDASMRGVLGFGLPEVPTLVEFENLVNKHADYEPCVLSGLFDWLDENPGVKIVTDVKQKNLQALRQIVFEYPDFQQRFIPQIYFPKEYDRVFALGFKNIIWTLYKYDGVTRDVINALKHMRLFAITMPQTRVLQGLAIDIKKSRFLSYIPSYTYTINRYSLFENYRKNWGIDYVYTDFLQPKGGKAAVQ